MTARLGPDGSGLASCRIGALNTRLQRVQEGGYAFELQRRRDGGTFPGLRIRMAIGHPLQRIEKRGAADIPGSDAPGQLGASRSARARAYGIIKGINIVVAG